MIRESIANLRARFPDEYWEERGRLGEFLRHVAEHVLGLPRNY